MFVNTLFLHSRIRFNAPYNTAEFSNSGVTSKLRGTFPVYSYGTLFEITLCCYRVHV
jgi:hypothetical protein